VFQFEGTLSHDDDYAATKLGLAIDERNRENRE